MVERAQLERSDRGLEPTAEGWFTVNVRESAWVRNDGTGAACIFEGDAASFADVGFTLVVVWPSQPNGMYHREGNQENFLVLSGECLLLIEGEERPMKAWDFVHCPPGTDHIFVGAGDGPCVIFMTGGRTRARDIVYPRSELALSHGAGVEAETPKPSEAYARFPKWKDGPPAGLADILT